MNKKEIVLLLVCIMIPFMAWYIGSSATITEISTWYTTLNKPWFNPPTWLFAPAWITLYILIGISLFFVVRNGVEKSEVRIALIFFAVQIALNALWSVLFFGWKLLLPAFVEIVILWIFILGNIITANKVDKRAAYLLIPYICWVSFAAILNLSVFLLNP